MNTQSIFRISKPALTSAAALIAMQVGASAYAAEDDKTVTAKLSGQINRGVLFADNGTDSDVIHVDNDNSSTRFRFVGEGNFSESSTVGITWESQFESNSTANVDINQNNDGSSDFTERKLELWYKGDWGKLSVGQGDGAANGTSEMDLSGTSVVMYSGIGDAMGGISFKTDDGAYFGAPDDTGAAGRVRIKNVFSDFDGLSRNDRLRYDTPALGPIGLAISTTNGDAIELTGRLAQDVGAGSRVEAALGWVDGGDRSAFEQLGGSLSFLHDSGFNATVAFGNRDFDEGGREADNAYLKLGYNAGAHRFAIDFASTDDLSQDGDEFESVGLGWNWRHSNSVEIYAIFRTHRLDRPGVNVDDVNGVLIGSRVKFL